VREAPVAPRAAGDHTGRIRRPKVQQASLLDLVAQEMLDDVTDPTDATPPPDDADAELASEVPATEPAVEVAGDETAAETASDEPSWLPTFDHRDDLGGLLAPRGKLLRRAFGAEPPR
jgi:hypothetical protein